jgi:hypothetical protein
MSWTTTITDMKHIESASQCFLLATINKYHFNASAIFSFDLNASDFGNFIKVPLTPASWVSLAPDCAGHEFIMTGAEFMHHTWSKNTLVEHPQNIVFRSKHMWRINSDEAIYSGGKSLVKITNQGSTLESFNNTPDLNCIHGIENKIHIVGGDKGYLMINRGQGWNVVQDVPTLTNIVDVHCVNQNEFYICAGYGGVFRWDGNSDWVKYETDPSAFMYNLCNYKGRMCVASLNLKSYWLDGNKATPITESKIAHRFKADERLLFGLGINRFEVFDGKNWRIYELDLYKLFPRELEAMYAAAPGP